MKKKTNNLKKTTDLNIAYTEGIKAEQGIGVVLKELGCPEYETKEVEGDWRISSASNSKEFVETCYEEIAKFIQSHDTAGVFVVELLKKQECDYDSWANREFLEKMFSTLNGIRTSIQWIGKSHIDMVTEGIDTTPKKVEELHRKNVLVLKDKVVACSVVHRVDYTCQWHKSRDEECIV